MLRIEPRIGMPNASAPNTSGTATSGPRNSSRASTCASRKSRFFIGLAASRFSSLRSRAWTVMNPMLHIPLFMMLRPMMPGMSQST